MRGVDAVVVAAGASRRMRGSDKLLFPLRGRALLAWTVGAMVRSEEFDRVVVVAPRRRAAALVGDPALLERTRVVAGGPRRQESVAAGVRATDAPIVLIHDGARPLVSAALIRRVVEGTRRFGAVIPVAAVAETVKRLEGGVVLGTVDREGLGLAQTPQGFRREVLEQAWSRYPAEGERTWTDEASLLEAAGLAVHAVAGEADNIKVTRPEDLARVDAFLGRRLGGDGQGIRVGLGRDSHPFGPRMGLALGGIHIAEAPALTGHSDGDALLHAIADALLGATAAGDLGRIFPAGDPASEGIASARLLGDVAAGLRAAGFEPEALDATVVGARPRLGAERLEAMRSAIAAILGLPSEAVDVKASSGNLAGDEGAGRVISAVAVATVRFAGRAP